MMENIKSITNTMMAINMALDEGGDNTDAYKADLEKMTAERKQKEDALQSVMAQIEQLK